MSGNKHDNAVKQRAKVLGQINDLYKKFQHAKSQYDKGLGNGWKTDRNVGFDAMGKKLRDLTHQFDDLTNQIGGFSNDIKLDQQHVHEKVPDPVRYLSGLYNPPAAQPKPAAAKPAAAPARPAPAPAPAAPPQPAPFSGYTPGGSSSGGSPSPGPVASPSIAPPAPLTGAALRDRVTQDFPAFAWLLDEPGLTLPTMDGKGVNLLEYAVNQGLSSDQFAAKLMATPWWQTHGSAARQWETLLHTDPASAQAKLGESSNAIRTEATRDGILLNDSDIASLADQTNRLGWSQADVTKAITAYARNNPAAIGSGDVQAEISKLKQMANDYLVPLTQQDLSTWALNIADGTADEASFQTHVASMSKGRFSGSPDIQAAIDRGQSPSLIFASLKNQVAKNLEMDPNQIDLLNPKWSPITQVVDPKTGNIRPMTLAEADYWSKGQDGFKSTQGYNEQANSLGLGLAKSLGLIPR